MQIANLYSVGLLLHNQDNSKPVITVTEPKYYCFLLQTLPLTLLFVRYILVLFIFCSKKLSDQNLKWICHRRVSSVAAIRTGHTKNPEDVYTVSFLRIVFAHAATYYLIYKLLQGTYF